MPKAKVTTDEIDVKALDEADYRPDGEYESYSGELPPADTELVGYIKTMYWTYTYNHDRMFKVLFIAADNEGEEEEFNGLPVWDNPFFTPAGKFRWKPFLDNFELTPADVKNKLYLEAEEHPKFGKVVTKVGTLEPSGETSWCRIITQAGFDQAGNSRVEVKKWLPYEDEEEPEEEPEELEDELEEEEPEEKEEEDEDEDEDEEVDDEYEDYEEDEEEDEEEEEFEEEAPPARKRPGARRAAAPATRAAAKKPAARARPTGQTKTSGTRQASTRTSKSAAKPAARAKTTTKAAPATTTAKRRRTKSTDEPPF